MGVSTEFKNVVENDSIIAVRSFLTNYLIGEDDFQLFDDALAYAADKVDVWQEHDGQEFSADKAAWTTDYLSELLVAVVTNFSRQRIDHIKAVVMETIIAPRTQATSPASTVNSPATGPRTGRAVITETIVSQPRPIVNQAPPKKQRHPASPSPHPAPKARVAGTTNSKTGRHIVSETEKNAENASESKSRGPEYGAALIVGGTAVTAIGVAMVKPVIIGTGVVMMGTGVVVQANSKGK